MTSPKPKRSPQPETQPGERKRRKTQEIEEGVGSPPNEPPSGGKDGRNAPVVGMRDLHTVRAPKAALLTIGLLVFALFAVREVDDVEFDGVKLADFAEPRLVLAVAMLFSLFALFNALYRHIATARVLGEPILFDIDPLAKELLRRTDARRTGADTMELGIVAAALKWATDLLVYLLRVGFLIALAGAVAWQLWEVLTPVVAAARAGNREMQVVAALAGGLMLAATLRAVSCLVVRFAPRQDLRLQLYKLKYPIRVLQYPRRRRKYRLLANQLVERARHLLEDPDEKTAFDESFNENNFDIRYFCGKTFWDETPDQILHAWDDWTNLQKWTLIQIVAAYQAEHRALKETIGLRPIAIEVPPEPEAQKDEICRTLIEAAGHPRQPPEFFEMPEPIDSLLVELKPPSLAQRLGYGSSGAAGRPRS